MKIMFHLFRKIVLKVKLIKYPSSGKNPLLVEDVLMQQIQANFQLGGGGAGYARGLLHHNLMDTENIFNEKEGH